VRRTYRLSRWAFCTSICGPIGMGHMSLFSITEVRERSVCIAWGVADAIWVTACVAIHDGSIAHGVGCTTKIYGIVVHALNCARTLCVTGAYAKARSSQPASPITSSRTTTIRSSFGTAACSHYARISTRAGRSAWSIVGLTTRSASMACRPIRGTRCIAMGQHSLLN